LREFSEGLPGQNYNTRTKLVLIDQSSFADSKRGLLYFGNADTNEEDSRIFLNTSNADTDVLPGITANRFEIDQDECIRLIPQADTGGTYEGLKGVFTSKVLPAATSGTPTSECEELTRHHLEIVPGNKRLVSAPAGLRIEGDLSRSYMESFARGAITQRFLYLSEFTFDTSNMRTYTGDPIPAEGKQRLQDSVKGFLALDPNCAYLNDVSIPDTDARRNRKIHAGKIKAIMDRLNPPMSLLSKMVDQNLFYKDQTYSRTDTAETFPEPPEFFSRNGNSLTSINETGGEGFRPFRHCTLYSTRFLYARELEEAGVYDKENGILNLRGIVSVEFEPVVLSAPSGSLIVRGQGAILAPNGFSIRSGISRENPDSDLCILFARKGNINISTSEPIEASLLAFNDSNNGTISPSSGFNVTGAVGVDRLYLSRYPSTPSQITYDPRLKVENKNEELFAVTISPWIRFENIGFSKN
jgi:hypothetical protein